MSEKPLSKKHRLIWIAVWFGFVFLLNLVGAWSASSPNDSTGLLLLEALSALTSPKIILLSIAVVVLIIKWKKKSPL